MADTREHLLTHITSLVKATDYIRVIDDPAGTPDSAVITPDEFLTTLALKTRMLTGTIAGPGNYYNDVRAQIPIFRTPAAITITRIHLHGPDSTPTTEFAGDLKFADDLFTGGFANATLIDVCDTTSGVFTATSGFDDATVPSGKYIYLQMDAAPHADWKDLYIEIYYTVD